MHPQGGKPLEQPVPTSPLTGALLVDNLEIKSMATRQQLIQLVHVGASKLFSDDEERRAWQQAHTGKTSCKAMTAQELKQLVKLLREAKAINPPKRAGRVPFNRSPYMSKIEAMLAEMELSWQYAEAIAWRLTGGFGKKTEGRPGVQRLEFVRKKEHFEGLIAALEKEQQKRRHLQAIEFGLELLELDERYLEQLLKDKHMYTPKWKRNLVVLKMLSEHLYAKHTELKACK